MRLLSLLDDERDEEEKGRERAMVNRLREAARKGSVPSLLELLQEDPKFLSKNTPTLSGTALHLASLLGHSAFAKEVLVRKPELAAELNPGGSSPLHLAAATGSVEIVKDLMLVNPDMCLVWDREGRTPLHLAAIKGRVGVLTELVRVRPEATRVFTSGGESGLHLCVKHNRLEALKVLVEGIGGDDEFVNWRDSNGNTVLHVAVSRKQSVMTKFLLNQTKIEVNAQNASGFTALDILSQGPRDIRDMEIKVSLKKAGALKINEAPSSTYYPEIVENAPLTQPSSSQETGAKQPVVKHKHIDWLGRKRSALMVVASLLASVAFQAAISPPGGVWQDDYSVDSEGNPVGNPHKVGEAVMAYNGTDGYGQFMIFNTIAFLASLSIILLLVSGLPIKRRRWMWIQMVTMWIAITTLTGTYFLGLMNMTPNHEKGTLYFLMKWSVIVWLMLMGIVFLGNVARMILWLLRKYGYIEEKPEGPSIYIEDDENDEL
ncbi:ankyrin repeat-containing protein NPR4-like [Juglans microcarpa x Juglans regia]|uniref:ankyrin repeat-containing protein NPR4-like n=1 Tax=Juglans microcarpa x Juglans regia TaxID=2249226 RepID=UPI001B7E1D10|nr:ankyrin repeat-containing protein NPR4-like [Juglans microcarpa x Juglans regia]